MATLPPIECPTTAYGSPPPSAARASPTASAIAG